MRATSERDFRGTCLLDNVAVMGVRNRAGDLWSQQRQAWLDKPWTWKLLLLLSLPPLISAAVSAETSPWFAAMALLLALVDLTLALVAYRTAKRVSTALD
ncbi:hypothetical protein AAII07_11185 [Microvirga sp. 0TCS3.31]